MSIRDGFDFGIKIPNFQQLTLLCLKYPNQIDKALCACCHYDDWCQCECLNIDEK